MLQSLRQASKSWVMKIILSLLALTFVVFFGNSFVGSGGGPLGGGDDSSLVEVGDVGYNAYQISQEFGRQIQRAQANPQFAGLTQEQAIQLGLLDQTVSQMVTRTLFDVGARDLGLTASDGDVSALVRQVPQFQNTAGRFDRIQFEAFLRNNRLSEQQYIEQLRGDLIRSQLVGTLAAGVKTPKTLIDRFYSFNAERRVAEIVAIDAATLTDIPNPDEAQLGTFYEANKDRFETPEYRGGVLVSLTLEQFAEEIGISDDDVANAYRLRQSEFITPERRRFASALFDSRQQANDARARIVGGEDFATVVEDVTGLPPVELGNLVKGQSPIPELGDAAFALDVAGVSEPVESPFGWNLVNVTEIQPRHEASFEDATVALRSEMAMERAREDIFEVLEAFEDELAGGATIEEAANATGLTVDTIGPVATDGSTPDGGNLASPDREILFALFSAEKGGPGRVVERDEGGFFAIRFDREIAPAIPPLSNVREAVISAWVEEQRLLAAEKLAGEIAEQALAGGSLTAAAAKAGYTATRTEPFDRAGQGAVVPFEAIEPVFEAERGAIVQAITETGAVVARVDEIVPPPIDGPERGRLRGAIAQSMANDLQSQLVSALRRDHEVDVDSAGIERLFTNQ